MIEIIRNRFGMRLREVYFAPSLLPSERERDIDVYVQGGALPVRTSFSFWTAVIDLRVEENALFEGISKQFRYEIRRALTKDALCCEVDFSPGEGIQRFQGFYDAFAAYRKLRPANLPKLERFRALNQLILATVRSAKSGGALAMHCYISDGERARLYYSATLPRNEAGGPDYQLVGRANKLLHWEAMLCMKREGISIYDFGGISKRDDLKGVDDFKLQFGGQEREELNAMVGVSWRGRLVLGARSLVRQLSGKPS